jgi:hypothetical protein
LLGVIGGFARRFLFRQASDQEAPNADPGLCGQMGEVVSAHFDEAFYAVRYWDVKGDLLEHFMTDGWRRDNDPAPWFSTSFYLQNNPDVAAAGLNPFYHYLEHGREEGRPIAPAEAISNDRSWELEIIRTKIDEKFYAEQLGSRGIEPAGHDLALHYWREGVLLGLDPTPEFSTSHYLTVHDDVARAGVNPFAHYLARGKAEGRSVGDNRTARREEPQSGVSYDRHVMEVEFDREYYLAAYPDVANAGVDPFEHFITTGWREGRNPNLSFSVSDYLDFYPDVAIAGINPFLHYLVAGKSEGRLPRHELGFRYEVIKSLEPLDKRVDRARRNAVGRKASSSARFGKALQGAKRLETKGLYLSVSHDDFTQNLGGVQLVLTREATAVDRMGFDHLHLFPAAPLQIAEVEVSDPLLGLLLNGKRLGFFRASDVERELGTISPKVRSLPFAIHSLLGHNAEALISIFKACGCKSGWYWIHDYSSACAGYTLLRNDVEFCGGPPSSSTACSICVYGEFRAQQMAAHQLLFHDLDLTVVAPSESALEVWKASLDVGAPAIVHHHIQLSVAPNNRGRSDHTSERVAPLRVAYLGQPVTHKGWPAFRDLAMRFSKDPRYEFHHLGKGRQPGVPVTFTEVAVGRDDPDAMVRTIHELDIDVAIIWSLWPETFCIAAVEALRAGAAILTYKDSGNVAAIVRRTGFGSVLDSEAALASLFESGEIIDHSSTWRPSSVIAEFSNMTADLIEGMAE